MTVLFDDDGGI